jgi:hypothetical protein
MQAGMRQVTSQYLRLRSVRPRYIAAVLLYAA